MSAEVELRNAYLTLVKRSVTDTLTRPEPNHDSDHMASFVKDFLQHYIQGRAITMVPLVRLNSLQQCLETIIEERIPGDVMEAGVWRGGCIIFMRAVLKAYGENERATWVADSFEGLPKPDAGVSPKEAKAHVGQVMKDMYKHFRANMEEVKANIAAYGLYDESVRFLKGWFNETLPGAPLKQLALLRLDADYYQSILDILNPLYDKVASGGFVIVDDYGEDVWTDCRKAVDDFRRERGITAPMQKVDSKCYFWRK